MRRHEADQSAARPDRVGTGVTGIVKAGLGIANDVHRRDVRRLVLVLVEGDGQLGPIGLVVQLDHFFHRSGLDDVESARGLAQPVGKRAQIVLGRSAERARLRAAGLDQDIAEPEVGFLDDVLEQEGLVALRRQRADVGHVDRLGDAGDHVGVAGKIAAQRGVERLGRRRRPVTHGERHRGSSIFFK
jgi:hypothetical protein